MTEINKENYQLKEGFSIKENFSFFRFTSSISQRLFSPFIPPQDPDISRRITLQSDMDASLQKLETTKAELREVLDEEIYGYATGMIDILVRQLTTLKRHAAHSDPTDRFNQWEARARQWTEIKVNGVTSEVMEKMLVQRIEDEVQQSIRDDIRIMEHYAQQKSNQSEAKGALYLALQERSKTLVEQGVYRGSKTLKSVTLWRNQIAERRQQYHDGCLELVDEHVN